MNIYIEPPHPCPYIPEETCSNLTFEAPPLPEEITAKLIGAGFRHFGPRWFTPACPACRKCEGIAIDVDGFRPSKSQRKLLNRNRDLRIERSAPSVTEEKLDLINKYHDDQQDQVGWFEQYYDEGDYYTAFIEGNLWCEEYRIYENEQLIGVGYMDCCDDRASSIYFYYDPEYRCRSLGTWSILKEIEICKEEGRSQLHLGLWNDQCGSLSYKNRFSPHEFLPVRDREGIIAALQEIFS